jgi:NADH:ubiquinone oxidoreductase subunit 5 (subunit L)/multisubunit Na+/H+ antiporter MnhA subunit
MTLIFLGKLHCEMKRNKQSSYYRINTMGVVYFCLGICMYLTNTKTIKTIQRLFEFFVSLTINDYILDRVWYSITDST